MTARQARILAIDDTPANLMTLGAALDGEFELQFATSGPAGLALALANPPDLILLDVMMPEMDGYETFRRLAAQPALQHIPVIFVTALNDLDAEVTGLSLGAADYITKPINVTIARQRIRNLVEREQLRKQVELQCDHLAEEVRQRQHAAEQLMLAASVFTHSREGITIADAQGLIVDVNAAFTRITGYSRQEALGQNPRILKSSRQRDDFYAAMWRTLHDTDSWSGEIWNRRKSGEEYPEMLTISVVRDAPGAIQNYVALFSDITERKAMEHKVQQLAFFDALTGLPNRRLLDDRLGLAMAASKRSGLYSALMFLDLDNFKPLNDTHGHGVGDLLLIEVAKRLTACVREIDTVARFGGDEFVVMLGELSEDKATSTAQAGQVAEKIRAALNAPYQLTVTHTGQSSSRVQHHCSVSIGVVVFNNADASPADIMKWADAAMYQAKDAGRNAIRFHEPAQALNEPPRRTGGVKPA